MKQSKTTIKELTARYRAVLLKCALINAMMIIGIGTAHADPLICYLTVIFRLNGI